MTAPMERDTGHPEAEVAWGPKGDMFFLPMRRVPVICATAGTIDPSEVVVFAVENEGSGDGDGGPDAW